MHDTQLFDELIDAVMGIWGATVLYTYDDDINAEEYDTASDPIDPMREWTPVGFICPQCGDVVYYSDWAFEPDTNGWTVCPICEEELNV